MVFSFTWPSFRAPCVGRLDRRGVGRLVSSGLRQRLQFCECGTAWDVALAGIGHYSDSENVATSATFGSGAVGGVFTPTLFIGSSIGFLFGAFVQAVSSLPGIQLSAFALIGMGAFLAAATRAPIMAIMLFLS